MFSTRGLLLLALACAPSVLSKPRKERAVLELTEETFGKVVANTSRIMVMFYAPWCGHCKKLAPEYKIVAKAMKADRLKTVMAKIDATVAKNLSEKLGVSNYPTLMYFKDNKGYKYESGRSANEIQSWLTRRERGPVREIQEAELRRVLEETDRKALVLVARTKRTLSRTKAFYDAAEELDAYQRAKFVSCVIWLPPGDPRKSSLTLHRPGFLAPDRTEIPFTEGAWEDRTIFWWAKEQMFPTVDADFSFSDPKYGMPQAGFELGYQGVLIVLVEEENEFDEKTEETVAAQARALLLPLAKKHSAFKFAVGQLDQANREHLWNALGITTTELIAVALYEEKKHALRGHEAVFKRGALEEFLQQVKTYKAKRLFKTEPPPEKEVDEHFVTAIVGSTFEKHAMDPTKDVLIYYHAPWAEHCKPFNPYYDQLGETASRLGWLDRGVVVAKMDASKNECEDKESQWDLYGYPKISLFPAVNKSKKWKLKNVYTGHRLFKPLANFLLDNAKNLEGLDAETIEGEVKIPDTLLQREKDARRNKKKRQDL